MKDKIVNVEWRDPATSNDGLYTVLKVVRQVAEAPGEVPNPQPKLVEVYKGTDRTSALEARDAARREMYA